MARGSVVVFDEFVKELGIGTHNLASGGDTIKLGFITDTITPTASGVTEGASTPPVWTDYSSAEVDDTSDEYPANGITLTGQTYTETDGVATFDDTGNISLAQDADDGFTDAYWGILYNASKSNKCIAYVDLAGPVSLAAGPITINWNAAGIFTISIS